MSSSLTEASLERKFQGVSNTQDSIQTLSLWLLHHKAHHKKIVSTWMKVLKKAKISQRLALFYLANDVIQNSKRKEVPFFKESFAEVLREATLFVRDEHIRNSVNRVFNIWNERSVYDSDFITDLQGILANAKVPGTAPIKALAEFKCENVIEKLKAVSKMQQDVANKAATVNINKFNATNSEIVQKLKDKMHGQQFSREFDENVKCIEELIKATNKEIKERNELIILLEQSEIYYDTQRGEAKIVSNAYKNFAARINSVQKKLKEMIPNFSSPIPSPTPDAPSPTNSDMELELPGETATPPEQETDDKKEVAASVPETSAPAATISFTPSLTTCVGNPIPTLSNLFPPVNQGKTASWFSSLAQTPVITSASAIAAPTTNDSGSLDSRLSSLFQNIPNMSSGVRDTMMSTSIPDTNMQSPGLTSRNTSFYEQSKDDLSGQNTPLQDEESPTTSTSTFFTRLASSSKASQSPRDILKGLTSLIQTAATKDKTQKPASSWSMGSSSPYETSSRLDVLSSNQTSVEPVTVSSSLSSPLFFTSPHTMANNSEESSVAMSNFITAPTSTLTSQGSLSYIPSIVPSAPKTHFGYQSNDGFDEYDPRSVNFKDDDTNSIGGQSNPTPLSESPSSPDEVLSGGELEDSLNMSRQSTLITLVSNTPSGIPMDQEENDQAPIAPENCMPQAPQAMLWPPFSETGKAFPEPQKADSVFNMPDAMPMDNGCNLPSPVFGLEEDPHHSRQASKIETVQSPRTRNPSENRWFRNDAGHYPQESFHEYYPPDPKSYSTGAVVHNYHHQSPVNPRMNNNWRGRGRPFGNNYNRGPMHKNFTHFPPRGRGRRWRSPLY